MRAELPVGSTVAWRDGAGFIHQGRVVFCEGDADGLRLYCVETPDGCQWPVQPIDIVDDVASAAMASGCSFV